MFQKLIAAMLAPLIVLYTCLPFLLGNRTAQTSPETVPAGLHSVREYVAYVEEHGAPAYSTATFVQQIEPLYALLRTLSGRPRPQPEEKRLNAHIDETLHELCGYIAENSSIDVELLITTLPNLNAPAELVNRVLRPDLKALREQIFALRDKAYAADQGLLGHLLYLLGVYVSIIHEVAIYTVPAEEDGFVEVVMDIVYDDGERAVTHPGIFINPTTGEVHGNMDKGMVDLGFDVNVYDLLIYGTVNCWQRSLGFGLLYDLLADATPIYNLQMLRFQFNYNNKDWMIQAWKGNYGLAANGFEVGVYNRPQERIGTFYGAASDDEMLPMQAALYHGDDLLMQRGPVTHWWLSAFKLTKVIYLPQTLTLRFAITFPNAQMQTAFLKAAKGQNAGRVTCTADGLTVQCVF